MAAGDLLEGRGRRGQDRRSRRPLPPRPEGRSPRTASGRERPPRRRRAPGRSASSTTPGRRTALGQLERGDQGVQAGPVRRQGAGEHERVRERPLVARLAERPDDVLDVLVRLLAAEEEEIGRGDPELRGDAELRLARNVRVKPRRNAVVDHVDPRGRNLEIVHQVPPRILRNGDDAVGARQRPPDHEARVEVCGAAGKELRVEQVDDVVDRHDGARLPERRQHVVRRMEEVEPVPHQPPGKACQLGDGVTRGSRRARLRSGRAGPAGRRCRRGARTRGSGRRADSGSFPIASRRLRM